MPRTPSTGVRDVSPRSAARQMTADEVRYPVPCPQPSNEEYAEAVKDWVPVLARFSQLLKDYSPGDCNAGSELIQEACGHLNQAAEVLNAIMHARGGDGLHRLLTRRQLLQDRKRRGQIRTDVHDVLSAVCEAVEARVLSEKDGSRKEGKGKAELSRMARNYRSETGG